jgi:hypothetical protein
VSRTGKVSGIYVFRVVYRYDWTIGSVCSVGNVELAYSATVISAG